MTSDNSETTPGAPIEVAIADGIATLALNRPKVLNALDSETVYAMRDALAGLRGKGEVRVLVLTGRGRGFCAGADLKDPIMADADPATRWRTLGAYMDAGMNALIRDIHGFDRPTLAAVNGVAAGGGVGLALAADIVIAAHSAYFAQVFAPQLGLIPDLGCTWHLPHLVGRARALGLAMLGDRLPAATAAEWGLIWRAVADDALEAETLAIAARLRDGAPRALVSTRRMIDHAYGASFPDQLDHERDVQSVLSSSSDFREAVIAFNDKRKPVFRGQ